MRNLPWNMRSYFATTLLRLNFIPTVTFDTAFADMHDLTPYKEFSERSKVACKGCASSQAANGHETLLAARIAADLFPVRCVFKASNLFHMLYELMLFLRIHATSRPVSPIQGNESFQETVNEWTEFGMFDQTVLFTQARWCQKGECDALL